MTKTQLAFMFNHVADLFYIEKGVAVFRKKQGGKKHFIIDDFDSYTDEEIEKDIFHPICDFRTLDELWEFVYKGKKIEDWILPLTELNIDDEWGNENKDEVFKKDIKIGDLLFK